MTKMMKEMESVMTSSSSSYGRRCHPFVQFLIGEREKTFASSWEE